MFFRAPVFMNLTSPAVLTRHVWLPPPLFDQNLQGSLLPPALGCLAQTDSYLKWLGGICGLTWPAHGSIISTDHNVYIDMYIMIIISYYIKLYHIRMYEMIIYCIILSRKNLKLRNTHVYECICIIYNITIYMYLSIIYVFEYDHIRRVLLSSIFRPL